MTNELRHTPKLRLLSAFLAAAMALTTLPAAAFAADGIISDLSVAGTSVTTENAADILRDGTAKYEGSVLTLNGEITVPQDETGIEPVFSITIDGTGKLTGTDKTGYGILPQADKAEIAAGADITLEKFNYGTFAYGVDVSGILTIRDVNYGVSGQGATIKSGGKLTIHDVNYGVSGQGATVESGGKLIIQNAENAISGGGAKVHGTLEIDEAGTAVDGSGVTVESGGVVTITGATSGLNGRSTVNNGSLSVSAGTCIDNGEVIFNSGTLKLDSTSGNSIKLGESNLTVNASNFWYRTARDGAWTKVTGGGWTRPDDAVYFEITTDDPAATHYTVTFNLNGGTSWGTNDSWISQIGGRWNDAHNQVSFTTQTGDKGECLNVPLMEGMAPKRNDYEFVGWYTAAVGGEPVEKQTYFESEQQLERITENITLYVHWQWNGEGPEPVPVPVPDETVVDGGDSSGFGAVLAVAGGAAVVGAAGFGIYELATRAILKDLLPEGAAIPATRGELALLLWQNAGKPEPAALPAFADTADAETAKAAQWCTEQGLLTAEDGAFQPEQKVAKYRVIRVWKQAAAPQQ